MSDLRHARQAQLLEKRIGERTLADARLAGDEYKLSPAGARLVECARKCRQLNGAPHEARRIGRFDQRRWRAALDLRRRDRH